MTDNKHPFHWWTATSENAEEVHNECDTREEAIAAARNDEHDWIVSARRQDFDLTIYGDVILENFADSNYELVGEDQEFLEKVTREQTDDLGAMLTATVQAWVVKHGIDVKAWPLADFGAWEKVEPDLA
jgi:hypothetical protein